MMKIWNWILSFFGFGGKAPTKEENLQKLLDDIGSSTNLDQCRRKAFQAIQKGDRIQPGMRHPYEATIRGDCIIVDTALTEYFNDVLRKLFGTASHLVTRIQNGIGIELAEARAVNVGQKVSGRIAIQTPDIEKLQSELSVARSNLLVFKGANGLTTEANYPDSISSNLYFIAAAAILEALFNILFLREQLDGIIAVFVAISVAAINVVVNAWFGTKYRYKNHILENLASVGSWYRLYAFLAILILNSIIAYVRYLLLPVGQDLNAQFLLESGVLFVIGIILGVAAFNKGYALDDPYPDYGRMTRKVKELEEQIRQISNEHVIFCERVKAEAVSGHQNLMQEIQSSHASLNRTLPEMSEKIHEWRTKREHLNHVFSQMQTIFRSVFEVNQPNGAGYPTQIECLQENTILNNSQLQVDEFINQVNQNQETVEGIVREIETSREELHDWLVGQQAAALWRWPN